MQLKPGPLIWSIIAINAAIWLISYIFGSTQTVELEAGFIPARILAAISPKTLAANGGVQLYEAVEAQPWLIYAWLTPFTSAFVHAGFMHLLFNMIMLIFCGHMLEKILGWAKFLLLYGAGAIGAALVQYLADPISIIPVVGASGAISAVMAFYFVLFARKRPNPIGPFSAMTVHMLWLFIAWAVINLALVLLSETSGYAIAGYAHIGGFIAGLLLFYPMTKRLGTQFLRSTSKP